MADRYSLTEARAIIDAERCVRPDHLSARCGRHGGWLGHENWLGEGAGVCKNYPEVAIVATQLLATVEEHEAADRAEGLDLLRTQLSAWLTEMLSTDRPGTSIDNELLDLRDWIDDGAVGDPPRSVRVDRRGQ